MTLLLFTTFWFWEISTDTCAFCGSNHSALTPGQLSFKLCTTLHNSPDSPSRVSAHVSTDQSQLTRGDLVLLAKAETYIYWCDFSQTSQRTFHFHSPTIQRTFHFHSPTILCTSIMLHEIEVDDIPALQQFLTDLAHDLDSPGTSPWMMIDTTPTHDGDCDQGCNACREADSVQTLQIALVPRDNMYCIDADAFGPAAFASIEVMGLTLNGVLASTDITKILTKKAHDNAGALREQFRSELVGLDPGNDGLGSVLLSLPQHARDRFLPLLRDWLDVLSCATSQEEMSGYTEMLFEVLEHITSGEPATQQDG